MKIKRYSNIFYATIARISPLISTNTMMIILFQSVEIKIFPLAKRIGKG